jgi:hypothetical protein
VGGCVARGAGNRMAPGTWPVAQRMGLCTAQFFPFCWVFEIFV